MKNVFVVDFMKVYVKLWRRQLTQNAAQQSHNTVNKIEIRLFFDFITSLSRGQLFSKMSPSN